MLFHTWEFLGFFLVVFPVYVLLKRYNRFMNLWLFIASYVFYGWWNPLYLILIFVASLIDWFVGLMISRPNSNKKAWLAVTLGSNLGILAYFKYYGFLAENINAFFSMTHLPLHVPAMDILLPVGISFFTFQSMSYTIDVFRGKLGVEKSFIKFSAFVSLFPQLVAGPIERASNLLKQLGKEPTITRKNVADGLSLFFVGLFKKLALADFLALYADKVYADPSSYAAVGLLFGTIAFAWQIFFDFSGYTDMARGIAKIMGFELMVNFNNPYTAISLKDFWQRWHISLSSWFRDYVYIPLGGSKKGTFATYRNMIITMVVSGFWHGAAWTFVIWGTLHAIGRALTMRLEQTAFYNKIPKIFLQLFIFTFVLITWVFFRARSVDHALLILQKVFTWQTAGFSSVPVLLFVIVGVVWLYELLFHGERSRKLIAYTPVRIGIAFAMLCYLFLFATAGHEQFIYFQF